LLSAVGDTSDFEASTIAVTGDYELLDAETVVLL
jgi:hypothetical protein